MEVLGRVTERVSDDSIKVEILRKSACGGKCGECNTSCGSKSYIIAKNYDNAMKDDIVKIESDDKKVLILSFLVFIIPLLVIVILYNFLFLYSEIIRASTAFICGVVVFVIIVLFFRKLKMPVSKIYYSHNDGKYR